MAAPKPGATPQNTGDPEILAISLPAQIGAFQMEVPKPSPNALYALSIGSNDVLDILANPGLAAQQQTTDVDTAVANEISFVKGAERHGGAGQRQRHAFGRARYGGLATRQRI
jgi:hypothetical protein